MKISRRQWLAAGAGALWARGERPPNIVFFMYDDLGSAGLGCYGQRKILTPHSDRLAREGTRFTACYAGGSVCAPSRSVLMTGLHLGHTPVRANAQTVPLETGDVTVAEVLKQAGYATGAFGKWGLGDAGTTGAATRQGFDEFFGYLHQTHAHNYWPEYLRDGEAKFPLPENVGRRKGRYSADLIAERMYAFIEKNRERPFFLFASPTLPHAAFHPPDDAPYSDRPWTRSQKSYAAMVTRADAELGRILDLVDQYKLAGNTIVFCTSDNGGATLPQNDHVFFATNGSLRGYKGSFYEGGIRVPTIVRWPGRTPAGRVEDVPWTFADVLPTLAEIAGAAAPKGLDGRSMVAEITGRGRNAAPRYLYWEQENWSAKTRTFVPGTLEQAVRYGQWKALRRKPGAPLELYDLARDPAESTDVAARNPQIVAQIEAYLKTARVPPRPHDNGNPEWVGRTDMPVE